MAVEERDVMSERLQSCMRRQVDCDIRYRKLQNSPGAFPDVASAVDCPGKRRVRSCVSKGLPHH